MTKNQAVETWRSSYEKNFSEWLKSKLEVYDGVIATTVVKSEKNGYEIMSTEVVVVFRIIKN